jgi:hypothetical protein
VDSQEFNVQGIGRASAITGDTEITAFKVTNIINPDCSVQINPPILPDQNFETLEDTAGAFNVVQTNSCASAVTFSLINDATVGGILSFNADGSFTFNPSLNYNGSAGSFTCTVNCGSVSSAIAEMSITVLEVAEDPYFTTNPPSILGLSEEDVWGYNPIGLADFDHLSTDLFIQTPVPNLPSWMAQPIALNDGSGSWYIPDSTVPAGTGAGTIDFTLTVEDPDGNTGTQRIEGETVVTALLNLQFVITTRPTQVQRSWVNDSVSPPVTTQLAAQIDTTHNCNRGTYLVKGNTTNIGRAYVGNSGGTTYQGQLFDSYSTDSGGFPDSSTGDVDGSITIPSAVAQGVSSTILSSATAPNQPYINVNDRFGAIDRYNLLTIDAITAQDIVDNSSGPNPEEITFGLFADTYHAGGAFKTHSDKVMVQIFKNGVEVYSRAEAVDAAITINVLTGQIIT